MPQFQYQGVDKEGKRVNGVLDVPTENDLRVALRGMNVRPTKITRPSAMNTDLGALFSGGGGTVKIEQLVVFTRQLNVLLGSGIPLVQSLEVLGEQTVGNLKTIVISLREKVSSGSYLWQALSAYPKAFPKLYIALIRAGESAGAIDDMLSRLGRYLEDSDRMRKLLKSAMMYPIIVTLIAIGVVAAMLIFVIPQFEELLQGSGQALPMPTQLVINLSHFLIHNILFILAGVAAVYYFGKRYVASEEGRVLLDRIAFRAPLFGDLVQKSSVARFSRTMQTLLASGINLIDAIDICRATIGNAVLEDAVKKIRTEVEAGKGFGTVLSRIDVFPKMAVQMISIGESTGNLDLMLEKVADYYEAEVEVVINGMTKLIEPIILVVLGGTVAGLMVAMYLPIFKLASGGA